MNDDRTSLGDGLYAQYLDDHTIKLTIDNEVELFTIAIVLTPDALVKLGEFAMREAKNHAS